jgi:presenilin-like A22 family membrane protease
MTEQEEGEVTDESRRARLVAIGALGFLLFGYPILAVFDVSATVLGVPVLWAYVFGSWAAVIVLVALAVRRVD